MKHPNPVRGPERGIEDLRELIAALDGRTPRLERAGEKDIVRDAARLRHQALQRIAELERARSDG